MESALISRVYARPLFLSRHRVASVPMRAIDIQKLYLRFNLGRATAQDRERFSHWPGWSVGMFVDRNAIEVLP